MSSFTMYMPPDEAIVICTLHSDWQAVTESNLLAESILSTLQRMKNSVYLILDMQEISLSMHDATVLANEISRGEYAFTNHAYLRGVLFVSPEALVALTAKGMRTGTFGNASVSAHPTLDDALATARSLMAE